MSKTDLLQSSIADAKLIREIAMMNAKAAIEESFAPHIKNMLTNKINEMEAEDMKEAEGDDLRGVLANLGTESEVAAYIESVEKDREQYDGWSVEDFEEDFTNYLADKTDPLDEEEDFDLDALLQEMTDEEAKDIPVNNEDPNANLVTEDEDIEIEDDVEDMDTEEGDEDDTEIDLENLTEEELTSFIEDVINDMVENGEIEAGEGDEDEEGEEDIDLEIEDETEDDESLKEVQNQLNESMKVNKSLRLELKELNLLNSKLLYSNKIFKSKVLTEAKKNKVLNAFDKVLTVKEAKITYDLLNESLSNVTEVSRNSNVVRGFASTPMVIKENKTRNTAILEDDALFKRFKTLAGL